MTVKCPKCGSTNVYFTIPQNIEFYLDNDGNMVVLTEPIGLAYLENKHVLGTCYSCNYTFTHFFGEDDEDD